MRIISLLNQKGGTGKTTTAINTAAALSFCGFKCLLIDIDPQGNLSQSAGFDDLNDNEITTYEVLKGEDINQAIRTKAGKSSYDVLPTDIRLSAGEIQFITVDKWYDLLKNAISKLNKSYDFIIIDCPPSLNTLSVMALTASTEVIIPVQAQYLPLKGVAQLQNTLRQTKALYNSDLKVGGVLLTFYDERRNLDKDVLEALDEAFEGKVFNTKISQNTKLAEAPSFGKDILEYSFNSKGSVQYRQLADEIIKNETTEKKE